MVVAIILLAAFRGLYIGLIREAFSIAALAGACVTVNYGARPGADLLVDATQGQIGPSVAPWVAGAVIAVITVLAIGMVGRALRRGFRAVGLAWADRLGGVALGASEGILLAALVVLGTSWVLGPGHPSIADSRSVAVYEDLQSYVRDAQREAAPIESPAP